MVAKIIYKKFSLYCWLKCDLMTVIARRSTEHYNSNLTNPSQQSILLLEITLGLHITEGLY